MIVCTGSIALDTTRTPFKTIEKALGGNASFFSYCASYFAPTHVVSIVGLDFPAKYRRLLEDKGIRIDGIQTEGKTFFVDWNYGYELSERTFNTLDLNCLTDFKPRMPREWRNKPYVFLGAIFPKQQIQSLEQMDSPKFTLLDTLEYYVQNHRTELKKAFSMVNGVLLNEAEARMYAKTPNLFKAAREVLDQGPAVVIIKKGEHGALLFAEGTVFPSPACPLEEVVDPTGAGDSFAGGFLGHVAKTGNTKLETLKQAMAYGHVLGSFAVEDFGLQRLFSLTSEDIRERYNAYRRIVSFEAEG